MTVYFFQIVSLLIALGLVNGMNALGSTDDDVDLQQNPADLDLAGSLNRPSYGYGGGYGGYGHGYGGGYGRGYGSYGRGYGGYGHGYGGYGGWHYGTTRIAASKVANTFV